MSFSFDDFYTLNRRVLIWIILLSLLWVMRDFLNLIFLTFLLIFVATPLVKMGQRWLRLPYRGSLILVYLMFVMVLAGFISFVTPNVITETNRFLANLGETKQRILLLKQDLIDPYPEIDRALKGYIRGLLGEDMLAEMSRQTQAEREQLGITERDVNSYHSGELMDEVVRQKVNEYILFEDGLLIESFLATQMSVAREKIPKFITILYQVLATTGLALLFSFLILIDFTKLAKQMQSLEYSRLRDFYQEAAQPVARFGYVIGRGIQAQAMIATVNTILTLTGMLLLSIPSVMLLGLIVFICGFIPVLGTFISTVPIALVALNAGGLQLTLAVLVLIIFVHILEAYALNPLIYGRHFKLNPVLVLMILFVGYHLFGIWGVLLGVPVTQYFLHHVFGVTVWREDKLHTP
ncbi:MAG TPA: AI-2E family transporter [Gammaproteobacteria bacterium]|nr:AI-2E family transporter [Gammaproteobacteria bacterium]